MSIKVEEIQLVQIRLEHIEPIRETRNWDNAGYSSQTLVTPEMQLKWFDSLIQDPPRTEFLCVLVHGVLGGTIWYQRDSDNPNRAELGKSMVFQHLRRCGLYSAVSKAMDIYVHPLIWWAHVKKDNAAALNGNFKLGWKIKGESADGSQWYIEREVAE